MISIKSGPGAARVAGLTPQAILGIIICHTIYAKHGYDLVITAGIDGAHMRASKHYSGNAWDMRTSNIPENLRETIRAECQAACGDDYDIVVEESHCHGEYDPKLAYTVPPVSA